MCGSDGLAYAILAQSDLFWRTKAPVLIREAQRPYTRYMVRGVTYKDVTTEYAACSSSNMLSHLDGLPIFDIFTTTAEL